MGERDAKNTRAEDSVFVHKAEPQGASEVQFQVQYRGAEAPLGGQLPKVPGERWSGGNMVSPSCRPMPTLPLPGMFSAL